MHKRQFEIPSTSGEDFQILGCQISNFSGGCGFHRYARGEGYKGSTCQPRARIAYRRDAYQFVTFFWNIAMGKGS